MLRTGTLKLILLLALCLFGAGGLYALMAAPVFEPGLSYELYMGTSSADIVETASPALEKFLRPDVRGESTLYEGNVKAALEKKFSAKLLFTEEAAGVVNYYYYAPSLGHGIAINGHAVNLHIAVSAEMTKVGTPVIFGGF